MQKVVLFLVVTWQLVWSSLKADPETGACVVEHIFGCAQCSVNHKAQHLRENWTHILNPTPLKITLPEALNMATHFRKLTNQRSMTPHALNKHLRAKGTAAS